jgi:hypothetical protein
MAVAWIRNLKNTVLDKWETEFHSPKWVRACAAFYKKNQLPLAYR